MEKRASPQALEALERQLEELEELLEPMMEQRKALKKSIVLLSGDVGHRRRRDNPKRLHDLVQERAGLTAAEIARELNISIPYVYALVSKDDEIERDEVGAHFIA